MTDNELAENILQQLELLNSLISQMRAVQVTMGMTLTKLMLLQEKKLDKPSEDFAVNVFWEQFNAISNQLMDAEEKSKGIKKES